MLTGVRTQEMRFATWDEIDLEKGIWKIPAE
jgi:integrase